MLSERFDRALSWASRLHAEQTRKGVATPYIAHLLAVSALAIENGADEDEAIAALLHDAVEDQGGDATRQEIRSRFGERVATIVDECTDTDETPKPPWRERKERYVAHLAHASRSARLVTACDKLHNAQSLLRDYQEIGDRLWERFNGGRDGTLWYYRAVADALLTHADAVPAVHELGSVVARIEEAAGAG